MRAALQEAPVLPRAPFREPPRERQLVVACDLSSALQCETRRPCAASGAGWPLPFGTKSIASLDVLPSPSPNGCMATNFGRTVAASRTGSDFFLCALYLKNPLAGAPTAAQGGGTNLLRPVRTSWPRSAPARSGFARESPGSAPLPPLAPDTFFHALQEYGPVRLGSHQAADLPVCGGDSVVRNKRRILGGQRRSPDPPCCA